MWFKTFNIAFLKQLKPLVTLSMENKNNIIPFEGQAIRKIWHDEQWYFSIVDVIYALTDSPNPSRYWTNLKSRDKELYPN